MNEHNTIQNDYYDWESELYYAFRKCSGGDRGPEIYIVLFLKRFYVFIFREGKGRRKRGRNIDVWETHQSVACCMPPAGDPASNPGMCPDWELNRQPFVSQAGPQSIEPHQSGLKYTYFFSRFFFLINHCILIRKEGIEILNWGGILA